MVTRLLKDLQPKYSLTGKQVRMFNNNSAILNLAEEKRWTVVDSQKRPLNIGHIVSNNFYSKKLFSYKTEKEALQKLDYFNNLKKLYWVNRTFRVNAKETNYIFIDIEANPGTADLKEIALLPIAYAELSANNGMHLAVYVPEHLIAKFPGLFDDSSVVKYGSDGKHSGVEVIFADHFISLTKRTLNPAKSFGTYQYPYMTDAQKQEAFEHLEHWLFGLAENHNARPAKSAKALFSNYSHKHGNGAAFSESYITEDARILASQFTKSQIEKLKAISPSDYGYDYSRYQFNVLAKAFGFYSTNFKSGFMDSANPFILDQIEYTMSNKLPEIPDKTIVLMLYSLALEILPRREKDDHFTNDMPFFMYQAQQVLRFFKKKHAEDAEVNFKIYDEKMPSPTANN